MNDDLITVHKIEPSVSLDIEEIKEEEKEEVPEQEEEVKEKKTLTAEERRIQMFKR